MNYKSVAAVALVAAAFDAMAAAESERDDRIAETRRQRLEREARTISVEGAVYIDVSETARYMNSPYRWMEGKPVDGICGYKLVTVHTLTFTLPDGMELNAMQIQALEERRRDLQARFQAAMTEIDSRISKLTAIEFSPSEAA